MAVLLATTGSELATLNASGHRLPDAAIYSRFTTSPVTVDGDLTTAEWSAATIVDLSPIPLNTAGAYLLVQNNDTMLFAAYDVVGDTTEGANDSAGLAFDGDHDGAPTLGGDGEYSVRASNDSACLPFSSVRCHYLYTGPRDVWAPDDPMDQARPFHAGLWAAVGFGPSQRTATPHRTYEFSIPLALIGQPTAVVGPGDVVGFFASRHASPYVGVWDADASRTASWPDNAPLGPNMYGHLYLAAQAGAALTPDYSYKPASALQPAVHQLTLRNMGRNPESFDISATSTLGWTVELRDNLGALLTDHGGNASLPDVGPLPPGGSAAIVVVVVPPPSAVPGDVDPMPIEARPWTNPAMSSSSLLRSAVPFVAPWSDNLEGGAPGWFVLPRSVNDWARGTPDPLFPEGPASAHSGTRVWGTNLAGNYSLSSFSILESPQVRIPDFVSGAHLTLWQWYKINGGYGDGAWVESSIDGGDWTLVTPEGTYLSQRFGGQPVYSGTTPSWVPADFNLTSYAGKVVAFRFILWDWLPNGLAAGWYIDDVSLQISVAAAGLRLTPPSAFLVGMRNDTLAVHIRIQNIGSSDDVFDLSNSSTLGWRTQFLDSFGLPLGDTEKPKDGFADTDVVPSGGYVNVTLNVTISAAANPGDLETITVAFRSSVDIGVAASGQYKFQVAIPIPYLDRMESGLKGWVADTGSMWHQVDSCAPTAPPWFISYSPCHSWWYGQDLKGNYATGFRTLGNLTSPPIGLFNVSMARLSFRYWYETESSVSYDQRWILIRQDNGPWPRKGESGATQMNLTFDRTWMLEWRFDLTSYVGHIVQIRFFFDSIDGQNNNHQGWYIDDVNVSAYTPGSAPPSIAMSRPADGERWSAGVPQQIEWNVSDDMDPPSALRVWVNYSLDGSPPWSPVPSAQAVRGDSSPVTWTPPCVNSTSAALNATVEDTFGLLSWTGPIRIELDCGKPSVIFARPRSPPEVSVKSNVSVTFSEPMNRTATQFAFGMSIVPGWIPVAGTFSWTSNTMYFTTPSDLASSTTYQVNVTTQAKDTSRPGNALANPYSWQFTTSTHADSPPTVSIVYPIGGEDWSGSTASSPVFKTLFWSVTDDFDPQLELSVWANYTIDGGAGWTPVSPSQPFNGTLDSLPWRVPCVNSSEVAIGIDAKDTGQRRQQVASPLFQIDCSPPDIVSIEPTGQVVPPSADIVVIFNESMNRLFAQAAFSLWSVSGNWTPVAGVFKWVNNMMAFTPVGGLTRGSTYQVNVSTMATDSSSPGNKLESETTWQFRVAQAAPPKVSTTDPPKDASDVSIDLKIVSVTFTTNVTVLPDAVNITPYVDFEVIQSGSILNVKLWSQVSLDTRYTVVLNASYVFDAYGNRLDGNGDGIGGDNYTFSFTTASTPPKPEEKENLPWMLMVPLVVAGFMVPLIVYIWRVRKKEKRRRERRKKPAHSVYRETIGPERRGVKEVAAEKAEAEEVSDSSLRPPF